MEAVYSGMPFKVISHGSIRDATVLAVVKNSRHHTKHYWALCEVEFDNYTALRQVHLEWFDEGRYDQKCDRDYYSIIYEKVRYPYLQEMVKNDIEWLADPKTKRHIEPASEIYWRIRARIDAKVKGFKKERYVIVREVSRLPLWSIPTEDANGKIVSWGERTRLVEIVRQRVEDNVILPVSDDPLFHVVVTNRFRVKDPRKWYGVVCDGMRTTYPQFGKRLNTDYHRAKLLEITRGDMDIVLVRSDNRLWTDEMFPKQYTHDCHGRFVAVGDIVCCGDDAYCVSRIEKERTWGKRVEGAWFGEIEITHPFYYVDCNPARMPQYKCAVGDTIVVNRHTSKGLVAVPAKVKQVLGKLVRVGINTQVLQLLLEGGDPYPFAVHWVTRNDERYPQVRIPHVGDTILIGKKECIIEETLDCGGYVYLMATRYKERITRYPLDQQPFYVLKGI
jgi:hypothetical protein